MPPSRPGLDVPATHRIDHNPRHEAIRKDITKRLRKSCSSLSEEAFAALVEKILKVQVDGERKTR